VLTDGFASQILCHGHDYTEEYRGFAERIHKYCVMVMITLRSIEGLQSHF